MPDNKETIKIQSTVITASDAISVITENFDMFINIANKLMPRRELLSLMGKDDIYMRVLAQVYTKAKGINAITLIGVEARNAMDYMDILFTANQLQKRKALESLELDRSDDGKLKLIIK